MFQSRAATCRLTLVNALLRRDARPDAAGVRKGASRRAARRRRDRSNEADAHGAETNGSGRGFRGDVGYRGRFELVLGRRPVEGAAPSASSPNPRRPARASNPCPRPRGVDRDPEAPAAARTRRAAAIAAASRRRPKKPSRPWRADAAGQRRSSGDRPDRSGHAVAPSEPRAVRRRAVAAAVWLALCVAYAVSHFGAAGADG